MVLFFRDMKHILLTLFILVEVSSFVANAQSTNGIPANIVAELKEMHDSAKWGAPTTNGVQLGVAMYLGDDVRFKKFGTSIYLYDTNLCGGLIYPPNGYRLELTLRDANGHSVEKTENGKAISIPMGIFVKTKLLEKANINTENKLNFLNPSEVYRYESFYLLNCFKVEKPGTNTLTVGTTIYKLKPDGWGVFEIVLPPTSMQVPITQVDLDSYQASKGDNK
jgi:hypothetical protein